MVYLGHSARMSNFVEVSKIEAARRHLTAGIELFFERKDPLIVYTTAWAAYQVLSELCKVRGVKRQLEDSEILHNMGVRNEVVAAFRKPRNFMQHADRDPDGVVKFFPDSSYLVLLLAVDLYQSLTPGPFAPGKVLHLWFYMKYPVRAPKALLDEINALRIDCCPEDYELFLELLKKMYTQSKQTGAGNQHQI